MRHQSSPLRVASLITLLFENVYRGRTRKLQRWLEKYEELKEACTQTQKLQNYVEQFIEGQDYQELESVVRNVVEKTISDNKKLIQNAFFSILLALRNDPDRYFIVDWMELTHFTTAVINYDSFSALRRPPYLQGSEQFVSGRVIEMAEKILYNLSKKHSW